MDHRIQSNRKRIKGYHIHLSEHFFEQQSTMDLLAKYGYQGVGLYLKICSMLLINQGQMKFNVSYFSSKENEQKIIEEIISESGLFYFNEDKTSFSSYAVDDQLEERGMILVAHTENSNKRKNKNDKPKPKDSTQTQKDIERENKLAGINVL